MGSKGFSYCFPYMVNSAFHALLVNLDDGVGPGSSEAARVHHKGRPVAAADRFVGVTINNAVYGCKNIEQPVFNIVHVAGTVNKGQAEITNLDNFTGG